MRLDVLPQRATLDTPVRIHASGLAPGQTLTLRASMADHAGVGWASSATFVATVDGVVDPAAQAPVDGSYDGVDEMGLFWAMEPLVAPLERAPFALLSEAPLAVTLAAEIDGQRAAEAALERLIVADGLLASDVREGGLLGRFFQPARGGPHPALLVFGGSGGGLGWSRQVAPLLARHGFATLALAYFGIDPLPSELVEIPLEYFATALDWLAGRPGVLGERPAVMGVSKGGELALLLGATFPRVRAVVAVVPSHVVQAGVGEAPLTTASSWSRHGQPLPCLQRSALDLTGGQGRDPEAPIALRGYYDAALTDTAAVARAAIPVERINGRVLMISGSDDGFWPSTAMADQVVDRLARHAHPYPVQHLAYQGAGHGAGGIPYLPKTITVSRHPVRGLYLTAGGAPATTAASCAASWPQVIRFLNEDTRAEG
jgi:dienelactone hydrolase